MATVNNFIPALWSAKILENLDKELVFSSLFNTDYEGEITDVGDTVHIGQIGNVNISDYSAVEGLAGAEEVTAWDYTLKINQAKAFNISVGDITAVQSKLNLLDAATQRAGYAFADTCDQYLANLVSTNACLVSESTVAVTKENAYEILVKMKTQLDKNNVPKQDRVAIVPPEFEGYMLMDPRFVAVATDASDERLTEGSVYKAAGFTVKVSNNCVEVDDGTEIVAGSPVQGTFAQQILKTEAYRPEKFFADAVKGLHVYGAEVLQNKALVGAKVSF